MTISSGRIVAGPTQTRADSRLVVAPLRNNIPPLSATKAVDGTLVIIQQLPRWSGEVIVYHDGANVTTMYVAVEVAPGLLEWKVASPSTGFIDSTTGKPFGL